MADPAPDRPLSAPAGVVVVSRSPDEVEGRPWRAGLEIALPASFLVLLALACFVWPRIYHVPSPVQGNLGAANLPPLSPGHVFGTDPDGYDVFSRILYGGRVSLEVGIGATALGMAIGAVLGSIAAFRGGVVDALVMRVLDMLLSFPPLILATVVASYLGPSVFHLILAISFFSIPSYARLARAETLRVREEMFVLAAWLSGSKSWRNVVRHVLPHVLPPLLTFGMLGVGIAIVIEASLSFLGLGIPVPQPSWGNMIAAGQQVLGTDPDIVLIPSAFLFVTILCLNLLGDGLRARWVEGS